MPPRSPALAVPALFVLLAACRGEAPPPAAAPAPRPVRVAPLAAGSAPAVVTGTGTLAARDEVPLAFKIGGVLARVTVDEGQRVQAGQLLAVLDLAEIDAGVARARSALEKAERDVARLERLHADSVAPLAQLQDARTGLEVARADLEAARFNQRYARITAPAAGTILRRDAAPGQLVPAGAPVLVLASGARGTVFRVGLADRDAARVRVGDAARVRVDAYPDRVLAGRVVEVAASSAAGTGTYQVEVALPDAGPLPTGLVGRVEIATRPAGPVTLVPVEAVVEADGDSAVVFVLADTAGRASRRVVRVAFLDGARVGVRAGLAGARAVVTDGAAYLSDGDTVQVVP